MPQFATLTTFFTIPIVKLIKHTEYGAVNSFVCKILHLEWVTRANIHENRQIFSNSVIKISIFSTEISENMSTPHLVQVSKFGSELVTLFYWGGESLVIGFWQPYPTAVSDGGFHWPFQTAFTKTRLQCPFPIPVSNNPFKRLFLVGNSYGRSQRPTPFPNSHFRKSFGWALSKYWKVLHNSSL